MSEQTRFGSPAVSHVRHASLHKPVNKQTGLTKDHGANGNSRKLIYNRSEI